MIDKQRIRALQAEIDRAKATGKPYQAWENLKQKHCAGKIQLTYTDLVWLGYLLGFRYGWATVKAFELGLFTLKHPQILPQAGQQKVLLNQKQPASQSLQFFSR